MLGFQNQEIAVLREGKKQITDLQNEIEKLKTAEAHSRETAVKVRRILFTGWL